jgi:uncharacterized membrane protein YdjX (TVP38/TMEM64 family)
MRYYRKFILPLILASGFASFYLFNLDSLLEWANVVDHYRQIKLYSQNNIYLAQLVFCLLYFLSIVFCLPIVLVLTLVGGALFGWNAFLLCLTVLTMGCCLVFFAAKGALLDFFTKRANPYLTNISKSFNKSPFSWLLLFRLIPILPIWLGNVIPAIFGMSFRNFILATLIGLIPGTLIYVSFARGLDKILMNGEIPNYSFTDNLEIFIPLLMLFMLAFVSFIVKFNNIKKLSR